MHEKGFTLNELLVAVAIIVVLSTVILASMKSTRTKSSDARIISQLNAMRQQSFNYTGSGVAFPGGTCTLAIVTVFETGSNGLGKLFDGIDPSTARCGATTGLPSEGSAWAVAVPLSTGVWCVDSNGTAGSKKNSDGTNYTTVASAIADYTSTCL